MFAPETTAGTPNTTFTTPSGNTLYVESNSGSTDAKVINKDYMAGSRFADIGIRVSKFSSQAQVQYPLFPYMGMSFLKGAIGKYTNIAAVASLTTTALATAGGITTLTFTTAPVVVPGQWIEIDSAALLERRQVITRTATTITVAALSLTHSATTAVVGPAQHKFSPLVQGDTGFSTLPTYTIAMVRSGNWAWYRAGTYVSGYTMAGAGDEVSVQMGLSPTVMPTRPGSPPSLAPQTNEAADAATFYTINDGFIVTPSDQTATGSSSMTLLKEVTDWKVDIQNNMVTFDAWNGNQHTYGQPGTANVAINYSYVNYADRNAPFEDYVASTALQNVPFFVSLNINRGTVAAPVMNSFGIYVPNVVLTKASDADAIGAMEKITVDGQATRPTGGDAIQVFCINALTPASNAY
jgi:hypothetical protein